MGVQPARAGRRDRAVDGCHRLVLRQRDDGGVWARLRVELLNRRRWRTRIELATAIHDYIERFHNTRRRNSALGTRTPADVEAEWLKTC
jgi:transposase InsO family protein